MRLVISGYYGYGNAGDEALLAGMLRLLRAERGDLDITVLSGDPPETERLHDVRSVHRARPSAVSAIARSDGLISGGGGLLQDRTSARPVLYYGGITQLARWTGRPYVVYAQGLGPIRRPLNRRVAAQVLTRASYVSLRDEESAALARELGVRCPIDVAPDPALALAAPASERGERLVVAVRGKDVRPAELAAIRDALGRLAADHPVVAISMHGPADHAASAAVVADIPGAVVVPSEATYSELLGIVGTAALVIGVRLHALVFAAVAGVPAVGVSYDPKVDAFARVVGQPVAGHLGTGLDPADIVAAARASLAQDLDAYAARVARLRADLPRAAVASLRALGAL
jgi:polysaccharide pyruvyl transferase CsaB